MVLLIFFCSIQTPNNVRISRLQVELATFFVWNAKVVCTTYNVLSPSIYEVENDVKS